MFLEATDEVPTTDVEEDKINFRDNLNLAIQHSNKSKRSAIEKHLEGIKHWGLNLIDRQEKINQAIQNRPIVLRNRRQRIKLSEKTTNLPYFFYQFNKDHSIPNLIWNHKVRTLKHILAFMSLVIFKRLCTIFISRLEKSYGFAWTMSCGSSRVIKNCQGMFCWPGIMRNSK